MLALVFSAAVFGFSDVVRSQDVPEKGLHGFPPLDFWLPEDYGSMNQGWAITEDKRGWIWVGLNNGTVIVNDGHAWLSLPLPHRNLVRSLHYDASLDRIYVGGVGEFGFFEPDSSQTFSYTSLSDKLPDPKAEFADVWRVFPVEKEVLFFTRTVLFFYNAATATFRIENDPKGYFLTYKSNNDVYLYRKEAGLFKISKGTKESVPFDASLLNINLRNVHALPNGDRILASAELGLTRLDKETGMVTSDEALSEINKILIPSRVYTILPLSEGRWAVGTLTQGVFVLDAAFKIRYHFGEKAGLADINIWSLFEDRKGGLWYGTNYGVGRADLASPIEFFDKRHNLRGIVEKITPHNGTLFLSTHAGLLSWKDGQFEAHPDIKNVSWDAAEFELTSGKKALAVSATNDVFVLEKERSLKVLSGDQVVFTVLGLKKEPGIVIAGKKRGISIIRIAEKDVQVSDVPEITDEIRQIVEFSDGSVWMEANFKGMWRFPAGYFSGKTDQKPVFYNQFGKAGNETYTKAAEVNGVAVVRTNGGMFRWDAVTDRFVPWALPGTRWRETDSPSGLFFKRGSTWWVGTDGYWQVEGDSLIWERGLFNTTTSFGLRSHMTESDSTILLGGNRGLIRIRLRSDLWKWKPDAPAIRINTNSELANSRRPQLWLPEKTLVFPFGASVYTAISPGFFGDKRLVQFRSKVEGVDSSWTEFQTQPQRTLERLPPGSYRISFQTRSMYGMESAISERKLVILPPWYLTPTAKASAIAAIVFAVTFVILLVRRYYDRRQARLEAVIEERTTDMRQEKLRADYMNLQLAEQAGQLRKVIEERRMLTGMVVHDLKNPIGAVRGYAELITENNTAPEDIPDIANRIVRVTQRMLQTISSLLNQDHLVADLDSEPVSISETTLNLLGEMMILANRKNQTVRSRIEQDCWIRMPSERIAMVVENLLSNAIKYTPRGGEILLEVGKVVKKGELPHIRLQVTDTGLGLSKEDLANLFQRYQTGSNKPTGGENATGLGLYAIKQTMETYGGTIEAFSDGKGKGSRFVVMWLAAKEPKKDVKSSV